MKNIQGISFSDKIIHKKVNDSYVTFFNKLNGKILVNVVNH